MPISVAQDKTLSKYIVFVRKKHTHARTTGFKAEEKLPEKPNFNMALPNAQNAVVKKSP